MKILIQRVGHASIEVEHKMHAQIKSGLLIFLGIEKDDDSSDVDYLVGKSAALRIFNDPDGKMNLSIQDVGGEALIVSQFTLHASTKKGNRPSYVKAARPEHAIPLYEYFIQKMNLELPEKVKSGVFGADMKIQLLNDGPVTIMIDSKNKE
jgi:D-tyrosyl-tRNA(Tyr) deacylase|tara:strand:+ start:1424 stop:1876 length:453 start_codon:yes stop_codon:yes gene_type:complete